MKKIQFCPLCAGKFKLEKKILDEKKRLVCQKCDFVFYNNPVPTVLAVIENQNKILLVKRGIEPYKGFWDIPGGFVEVGQTIEKAIKSEIKEELNGELENLEFLASFTSHYPIKYINQNVIGIAFKVKLKNKNLKASSDISEFAWFDKNNLPQIAPLEDVQQLIKMI